MRRAHGVQACNGPFVGFARAVEEELIKTAVVDLCSQAAHRPILLLNIRQPFDSAIATMDARYQRAPVNSGWICRVEFAFSLVACLRSFDAGTPARFAGHAHAAVSGGRRFQYQRTTCCAGKLHHAIQGQRASEIRCMVRCVGVLTKQILSPEAWLPTRKGAAPANTLMWTKCMMSWASSWIRPRPNGTRSPKRITTVS